LEVEVLTEGSKILIVGMAPIRQMRQQGLPAAWTTWAFNPQTTVVKHLDGKGWKGILSFS